ncbi:MAG: 1-(5-phosphoribosyl)-5-[(5-phosphoribosylamino)methylideneamino]imidazole-4-carboxamide isomerase [Candidatus Omnitrophota bacterium]
MLIIPAVDIKDGCVVRLVQGKFNQKKIYSKDPLKASKHWVSQGAKFIHVVDLDGALTGNPLNLNIVKEIVKNIDAQVQFGGGVRKVETIKELLNCGVSRVVLGTRAAQDESFLKKCFKQFKDRIIVSIDAKDGIVSIKGWDTKLKGVDALKFGCALKKIGFKQVIFTDIAKDGTLKGPNIKAIKSFLKETGLEVIGSGGISSLDDLRRLKSLEKAGLIGIIVGKALYEGRFTLPQALKIS